MFGKWLRAELESANLGQADLSRLLTEKLGRSIDRAAINKIISGGRNVRADELLAIEEILGVSFKDAPKEKVIPLKRYVGAGQAVFPIDDGNGDDDYIEAPPGLAGEAVAAVIRGDSMFPRYDDGNIIMWSQHLPPMDLLHREAVVGLADGRILVKTIERGSANGFWTLISFNAPPIPDVVIEWAAPIDWVKRR